MTAENRRPLETCSCNHPTDIHGSSYLHGKPGFGDAEDTPIQRQQRELAESKGHRIYDRDGIEPFEKLLEVLGIRLSDVLSIVVVDDFVYDAGGIRPGKDLEEVSGRDVDWSALRSERVRRTAATTMR